MMWGGLLLGLAVYVLFGIVPMVGNIIISFTDYTGLPGQAVHNLGFANYTSIGSTQAPGFEQGIVATLVFVVAVTVGQNAFALLFAHKLKGSGKFAAVGRLLVFLPIALGVTVVGLIWILIFNPQEGPMASLFGLFGVHPGFFGADYWAMTLVILSQSSHHDAVASMNNGWRTVTKARLTWTSTQMLSACSMRLAEFCAITSTAPLTLTFGAVTSPRTLCITTLPTFPSGTTSAVSKTSRRAS